jgi:tight adherence protein B
MQMSSFILILLAVWGSSMAVWWLLNKAFHNADVGRIKDRLAGNVKKKETKESKRTPALITPEDHNKGKLVLKLLQRFKLRDRLQTLLEQAGLKYNVARLVHFSLAMFLLGFGLAWLLLPTSFRQLAFLAGLLLGAMPLLSVLRKKSSRMRKFEEQFPESLEFVARSMRAGHAFSVSLEMIHREFQEPLAGEFRRTFEEHNLGLPLDVALQKLSKRVPSLDVHFFVSAVMLQKRTGGNLAEILDKLAYVIRERFKLRGRIRAISAHGRMTGLALTMIPIGVAVLMFLVNPDYVRFFIRDEVGNYMMGAAIALQLLGYAVIKKIVSIEV